MSKKLASFVTVVLFATVFFGYSLWIYLKPTDAFSESERRQLATLKPPTVKTLLSGNFMSDFETYSVDQLPLRDSLRTVKAVVSSYLFRLKDNNKIYVRDGYASKLEYPLSEASLSHASDRIRFIYDQYLKDATGRVYLSIIPDKNYFLADANGYLSLDYDHMVSSIRTEAPFAEYIDIFDLLSISDYYKTDTHWRQENIVDVARRLADAMSGDVTLAAAFETVSSVRNSSSLADTLSASASVSPSPAGSYEQKTLSDSFYGVYYGQSALPLPPEPLNYLTNAALENATVFDYEADKDISIYDFEKGAGRDPYEFFLSGSRSLLTIKNEAAATDRELILFRDSFGSSIAPLLCEYYSTITLVDIRYIAPQMLSYFIDFTDKDVLFLYSTIVLNNSVTFK